MDEKNRKILLTKIFAWCNIYFAVAEATLHICDSSLVGKAPPCQGGDRGFEPRLSLFETPDFIWGFCYSEFVSASL